MTLILRGRLPPRQDSVRLFTRSSVDGWGTGAASQHPTQHGGDESNPPRRGLGKPSEEPANTFCVLCSIYVCSQMRNLRQQYAEAGTTPKFGMCSNACSHSSAHMAQAHPSTHRAHYSTALLYWPMYIHTYIHTCNVMVEAMVGSYASKKRSPHVSYTVMAAHPVPKRWNCRMISVPRPLERLATTSRYHRLSRSRDFSSV